MFAHLFLNVAAHQILLSNRERLDIFDFLHFNSLICRCVPFYQKALYHNLSLSLSLSQLDPSLEAKVNVEKQSVILEEQYEVSRQRRRSLVPAGKWSWKTKLV